MLWICMYLYLFEHLFPVLLDIPRSEIAVSPRQFCLCCEALSNCYCSWTILHSHQQCMRVPPAVHQGPTSRAWGSHQQCMGVPPAVLISFHLCQYLLFSIVVFVHYSLLSGYEMVSHCGFDLQFVWLATLQIFPWAYWLFVSLLLRNVFLNPLPFFFLLGCLMLLSCESSLYILNGGPISDIWFVNIFNVLWCKKVFNLRTKI